MVKEVRPSCHEFSVQQWPQVDSFRIKGQKLSDTFPGCSYSLQQPPNAEVMLLYLAAFI